jgi:predicted phage tail protein
VSAALTEIRLYGALAAKYGPVRRYAVSSPRSAYKALQANLGDFFDTIETMELRTVISAGADPDADDAMDLDLEQIPMKTGRMTIHIIPVPAGAVNNKGRGTLKTVVGLAIITIAFIASGGNPLVLLEAPALFGASMALSGISLLIAPAPPGVDPNEREDDSSTLFNSTANVAAQGHPVPIIYGLCKVGSVVVSAGYDTDQIKLPPGVSYDATTDTTSVVPADYYTWTPGVGGGDFEVR